MRHLLWKEELEVLFSRVSEFRLLVFDARCILPVTMGRPTLIISQLWKEGPKLSGFQGIVGKIYVSYIMTEEDSISLSSMFFPQQVLGLLDSSLKDLAFVFIYRGGVCILFSEQMSL